MFDELQWALSLACASGRSRVNLMFSLDQTEMKCSLTVSIIIVILVKKHEIL